MVLGMHSYFCVFLAAFLKAIVVEAVRDFIICFKLYLSMPPFPILSALYLSMTIKNMSLHMMDLKFGILKS